MADRLRICSRLAAFFLFLIVLTGSSRAEDAAPLTVTVQDGDVLFHGAALDLDQLQSQLSATGRKGARVYLRIGSNAKSVYVDRVIAAIRAAGFANIAILGPPGMEKDLDPPV